MKTKSFVLVAVAVFAALIGGVLYVALDDGGDDRRVGALTRSYSAGRFALEFNGQFAGYLKDIAECHVEAEVLSVEATKQTGAVRYGPCHFRFGMGMTPAFYGWVANAIKGSPSAANLAISLLDINNRETRKLELPNSVVSGFVLPPLDAAAATPVHFELSVAPELIRALRGSGATVGAASTSQKSLLSSNFRVTVGDLDGSKITKVSGLSVDVGKADAGTTRTLTRSNYDDVTVELPDTSAATWEAWLNGLLRGTPTEKAATIELLSADRAAVYAKFSLTGVGLSGGQLYGTSATTDSPARRSYPMYVEGATASFTP